jgi:hypothetical protein
MAPDCRSVDVYKFTGGDGDGYEKIATIPEPPVGSKVAGIGVETLKDWRLGGTYYAVVIDIDETNGLKEYLQAGNGIEQNVTGTFNGFVVYVQTADGPYLQGGENKIALVKLKNGSELPVEGLTIATNGRLWVEGDYNIVKFNRDADGNLTTPAGICSDTDWEKNDGSCHFPSAAIYSDSLGVLSGTTYSQSDYSNSTRNVAANHMVNTAVVTGYLPSQLQERFPDCGESTDPALCFIKSTSEFTWGCSSGWDAATGFPNAPLCWQMRDPVHPDSAVYLYRTVKFFREIYKAMAQEYYGYHTSVDNTKHRFPGCSNRWTQWTTPVASGGWELTGQYAPECPQPPHVDPTTYEPLEYRSGTSGPISALDKLYHTYSSLAPAKWSDLTTDDMDELKPYASPLHYRIPIERNDGTAESPNWKIMCDGSSGAAPCATGTSDWKDDIIWREFDLDFNMIPEINNWDSAQDTWVNGGTSPNGLAGVPTIPVYSTGAINCSDPNTPITVFGRGDPNDPFYNGALPPYNPASPPPLSQWPWWDFNDRPEPYSAPGRWPLMVQYNSETYRTIQYQHGCQIEPAAALGGVPLLYHLQEDAFGVLTNPLEVNCTCAVWKSGGCSETSCSSDQCQTWDCDDADSGPTLRTDNNRLRYKNDDWWTTSINALYTPKYSGGLENLINFQEKWLYTVDSTTYQRTFRFGGVMTAAWHSTNLEKTSGPAFYKTSYYSEPVRKSQYDRDLKGKPPAGTPGLYSFKRLRFQELDPNDRTKVLGPQS